MHTNLYISTGNHNLEAIHQLKMAKISLYQYCSTTLASLCLLISLTAVSAAPIPGRLVGEKLLEWTIHEAFPADPSEALTSEVN